MIYLSMKLIIDYFNNCTIEELEEYRLKLNQIIKRKKEYKRVMEARK
jgi:hypothetical protein